MNLPMWDHFSAAIRHFQERGVIGNLAMAKADHRDAYKQLPVKEEREMLAVVALNQIQVRRGDLFLRLSCLERRQRCFITTRSHELGRHTRPEC